MRSLFISSSSSFRPFRYGDADAGEHTVACKTEYTEVSWAQTLAHRFQVTAEVMVSKIFPAGFGWQGFSVLAENYGMASDSMSFALTTGLGDGLGVVTGHTLFMALKKAATGNESIDVGIELQTGILLGSAAFCSGTAWQPVVNALTATGPSQFCGTPDCNESVWLHNYGPDSHCVAQCSANP